MAGRFRRKDFLEALFGEYLEEKKGFIRLLTQKAGERKTVTRYFPTVESLAKEVFLPDQNVYVGVCPHENMKSDKAFIRFMTALWAGLDVGGEGYSGKSSNFQDVSLAAKAVRSFPLPPSIVVESGRGVHLYWLLQEVTPVTDIAAVEGLLTRISHYFLCKRPITLDSFLRLPETTNCKIPSQPLPCTIKYINNNFRYTIQQFQELPLPVFLGRKPLLVPEGLRVSQTTPLSPAEENKVAAPPFPLGHPQEEHKNSQGISAYLDKKLTATQVQELELPEEKEEQTADETQETEPYELYGTKAEPDEESPLNADAASLKTQEDSAVMAELVEECVPPQLLADQIVERIVERFSSEFMERLADEIVEKLYQRIFANQAKK